MSNITLNRADETDCKDLWVWRNHPEIRKNFFNDKIVSWKEHEAWFRSQREDKNTPIFIAALGKDKIGVIRFETSDNIAKVSVNLNPDHLGKSLGWQVISLGTNEMLKSDARIKNVIAEIKRENIASQKAFVKAGYELGKKSDEKMIYVYTRK